LSESSLQLPVASLPTDEAALIDATADFDAHLGAAGLGPLRRARVSTLQLNIGLRCNLACQHCHVESGPKRTEQLSRQGVERIAWLLERSPQLKTLDLTGGAPELHPDFRWLVARARSLGRRVIDRCNLTVLFEPGQEDTAAFLAEQGVDLIASLPCHGPENVEAQRGKGVFDLSIAALQKLNALGYGDPARKPGRLDLVYNPVDATLPPPQAALEADYRRALRDAFGIEFDTLLTITNMPIKRFAHALLRDGELETYMDLLIAHFNPDTLDALMCRHMLSIDHAGRVFDCDFDQALGLVPPDDPPSIFEIDDLGAFEGRAIATGAHCFGCTAGAGSSCGGSLL